jgi:hypothetical protein
VNPLSGAYHGVFIAKHLNPIFSKWYLYPSKPEQQKRMLGFGVSAAARSREMTSFFRSHFKSAIFGKKFVSATSVHLCSIVVLVALDPNCARSHTRCASLYSKFLQTFHFYAISLKTRHLLSMTCNTLNTKTNRKH